MIRAAAFALGPVLAGIVWIAMAASGAAHAMAATAAITTWVAIWWVFEPVPIPATSLLPFALLPLTGVLKSGEAGAALGDSVILLLLGAFLLSKALEKSGVHERFAAAMIRLVGRHGGGRLVFAFVLTAALLSMWISNTATVLVLVPMALPIIARSHDPRLGPALLLGIAYASSVGGMGTLIGTPPNVIFAGNYRQATGEDYGFVTWMTTGVPIVAIAVPLLALWLSRGLRGGEELDLDAPGPWRSDERRVLCLFGLTIAAWVLRTEPFGGWTALLGVPGAGDDTVAIAAATAAFVLPNGRRGENGERERLLDWPTATTIPWGVLLLFAGGICLAKGFAASGLSREIGEALHGLGALPPLLTMLAIALVVTFLTEITSNTATATLLMPVLAAAAAGAGVKPALFMIPAAISASCAFMLPVATAPNAIVYSTGRVTIAQMAREGLVLNLLLALVIAAVAWATVG